MQSHAENPQLWFRAGLSAPLSTIVTALKAKLITTTIRLGVRNAKHPKGYHPGQRVTLLVLDAEHEVMRAIVRITFVVSKPLGDLTSDDLRKTIIYASGGWQAVQRDLSIFSGYDIAADEMVSIVKFEYVSENEAAERRRIGKERYPGLFLIYGD